MGKMSRFDWNPLYESPLEGGPTLGRCPRRVLQDLRDVPRGCGQIGLFGQQARQPVGQELRVIERSVGLRQLSLELGVLCAKLVDVGRVCGHLRCSPQWRHRAVDHLAAGSYSRKGPVATWG